MDVIVVTAVMLVLGGGHFLLVRRGPGWAGAVVPALWTVMVIAWAVGGQTPGIRQFYVGALVLIFLIWTWLAERRSR